jgi:hypothetical protein
MTIRIERQALLRVISARPSQQQQQSLIKNEPPISITEQDDEMIEDEFVVIDLPPLQQKQKPLTAASASRARTTHDDDDSQTSAISSVLSEELDDDDDDEVSVCSSTKSRVSFSDELVTDVWTRPYTPTEDVPSLFYSSDTIAQVSSRIQLFLALFRDLFSSGFLTMIRKNKPEKQNFAPRLHKSTT